MGKVSQQTFCSLAILEALLTLVNKRPNIQEDFKSLDGYALLQRIFTSISSLNLFQYQEDSKINSPPGLTLCSEIFYTI